MTTVPGLAVAVASADCVPLLLAAIPDGSVRTPGAVATAGTPQPRRTIAPPPPAPIPHERAAAVAAVHAGWRGLAAGVVEAGVAALRAAALEETGGTVGHRILAAIGPAAGPCCYEVGPDVIAALDLIPGDVRPTREGKGRIDLRALVAIRLERAGLRPGDIERVGPCTVCSGDWPSYRRQGEAAGRILSFISLPAPPSPR